MRELMGDKRGQFVIIAVLMIAVMIISIGALMHRAVTYYRHEPWEEYLALIGNVELNSKRLVELSLANYTQTPTPTQNQGILKVNLEKWKTNAPQIYLGRGVTINYELANRSYNIYGANVNYLFGLNYSWYKQKSFSAANATFTLNITSIGLSGYKFAAVAFLNLTILNASVSEKIITVTVKAEDKVPVAGLGINNFDVKYNNISLRKNSVALRYDSKEVLVYVLKLEDAFNLPVEVEVTDFRGIKVIARYSSR